MGKVKIEIYCYHCTPGRVAPSEASSLGMQAAPSSIPTSGTFFCGDLVMKTFLRPISLFRWFKKSSRQLLAKECAISTGKLPRRLAQEQCGKVNWPRPKWPKMCWRAVKQKSNQTKPNLTTDILTTFYRNVPGGVFYKPYEFCPYRWFWLVAMATEMLNFWKKKLKIFSQKSQGGCLQGGHWSGKFDFSSRSGKSQGILQLGQGIFKYQESQGKVGEFHNLG